MAVADNREESDREEDPDPEALGMPDADEEDAGDLAPVFAADEHADEEAEGLRNDRGHSPRSPTLTRRAFILMRLGPPAY
jgi:hypothetical protein